MTRAYRRFTDDAWMMRRRSQEMLRHRARLISASLAVAAVGVVAHYASASFTATATATGATDTGAMEVVLGAEGSADNRLTIAAALSPGESAQRAATITIENEGATLSGVTLTTSGTNGPPAFFTDTDDGMTLWIARCSDAWAEAGVSPDFRQSAAALSNLDLDDTASNHLRIEITFPADAPPSMYGQTSDISFTFDAMQRTGASR
jgi:flagellar capping protein FliD